LITSELPAARAAATFFIVISSGWFHGVISPATPSGTRRTTLRCPGPKSGMLPSLVWATAAKYSSHSGSRFS
jgi:hypothetical protein